MLLVLKKKKKTDNMMNKTHLKAVMLQAINFVVSFYNQ